MAPVEKSENKSHFHVRCHADSDNHFAVNTESLTVTVGQRVLRDGSQEMWESVTINAKEDGDGTLIVQVLVFNPDWDEPLQIACIRSRPGEASLNLTALGCNLDHVTV
jgi:hypothetical protein